MKRDYVDAQEAAQLLGVKLATLYAYVSRGLIESTPAEQGRARRYRRVDVERLRQRRGQPSRTGTALGSALRWGEPVLDSTVSQLTPRGPLYRGHAAVTLAAEGTRFEAVAELLWNGELGLEPPLWPLRDAPALPLAGLKGVLPQDTPPLPLLSALVPLCGARDAGRYSQRTPALFARARALIRQMSAGLGWFRGAEAVNQALRKETICQVVASALGVRGKRAALALEQALVLWADHELNASTFAARVAASAGADLYSCFSAGLAALSGPRHGAACERVEALLAEVGRPEQAARVVRERSRRGEQLPGFGHPIYPQGDPRCPPLLALAKEIAPRSRELQTVLALVEAMADLEGSAPTVDVGTVALARAIKLPAGGATALVAVGRSAGWVAHVAEQYSADFLIRPRARFSATEETC